MIHFEVAGHKFACKDLVDSRTKLTELLQKVRADRESHEQQSAEFRRQEKSLLKMLSQNGDSAEVGKAASSKPEEA